MCVNQGAVESGHYWCYVRIPKSEKWFKCNDEYVHESSWDEMYADAYGNGTGSAASIPSA